MGAPAKAAVALAVRVTLGSWLLVNLPRFTCRSSDSGMVPPLANGVMWMPAARSEKVRPMSSAESFLPSAEPGVTSSRSDGWLLVRAQRSPTPSMRAGRSVNFWRNSSQ